VPASGIDYYDALEEMPAMSTDGPDWTKWERISEHLWKESIAEEISQNKQRKHRRALCTGEYFACFASFEMWSAAYTPSEMQR
jgi:hypothetical protein